MTHRQSPSALSIQDRASRLQDLLRGPLSRLRLVFSANRTAELDDLLSEVQQMTTDSAGALRPRVAKLTVRPRVGEQVMLSMQSTYLHKYHGASYGSIGTVVAHSELSTDDDGVLVDWGTGGCVRCDLQELALPVAMDPVSI